MSQPDYRQRLYEHLKAVKDENGIINFKVQEPKENGFLIKVGGLYGFAHLEHLPWRYERRDYWKAVGKHLAGLRFRCRVYALSYNPIRVIIDGAVEAFTPPNLEAGYLVDAVVLAKIRSGLVVDAGYQFQWRGGPVVGFLYRGNLLNAEEYETAEVGQVLSTCYLGYNYQGRAMFGDFVSNPCVITPGIEKLVGEKREVLVSKQEGTVPSYFVDGIYPAKMPASDVLYPGCEAKASEVIRSLKDQDRVCCEIVDYSQKHYRFKVKLEADLISL